MRPRVLGALYACRCSSDFLFSVRLVRLSSSIVVVVIVVVAVVVYYFYYYYYYC